MKNEISREKENKMKKTIRIFGRERQTTDGQTYTAWSYTKDGGEFYDVKFTQDCTTSPKKPGYYLVEVDTLDVSKQKARRSKDGFKFNDILWIKNVISCKKDDDYENELKIKRLAEIEEIL